MTPCSSVTTTHSRHRVDTYDESSIRLFPIEDYGGARHIYTFTPPYGFAGGRAPQTQVIQSLLSGEEYFAVHDVDGNRVLSASANGTVKFPLRRRLHRSAVEASATGNEFITFEGGLYRLRPTLSLTAKAEYTHRHGIVIDVTCNDRYYSGSSPLVFHPRQAWAINEIARRLNVPVRFGCAERAAGLSDVEPLDLTEGMPNFESLVYDALHLPHMNSRGLRALADLKSSHYELDGPAKKPTLETLIGVTRDLLGLTDSHSVGCYEGDAWNYRDDDSDHPDDNKLRCDAAERRMILERMVITRDSPMIKV